MIAFPSPHIKLRKQQGKTEILDALRSKYVALTPEEAVRQSMIEFLWREKAYPKGVIAVEHSIVLNGMSKRVDILVYSSEGEAKILIECKAPQVALSQHALDQASRYNRVVNAPYVCLYNGYALFVGQLDMQTQQYKILQDIPKYGTY